MEDPRASFLSVFGLFICVPRMFKFKIFNKNNFEVQIKENVQDHMD